jgi:hypothetical protein
MEGASTVEYLKIPKHRRSEFVGDVRYYYVVKFDVLSEDYSGETMIPSDIKLSEDQIFAKAQEFLKTHFNEVFDKYQFAAELSIPEAYDAMLK